MITESNFENLLAALNFTKMGKVYEKEYTGVNASMRVDFSSRKLYSPGY